MHQGETHASAGPVLAIGEGAVEPVLAEEPSDKGCQRARIEIAACLRHRCLRVRISPLALRSSFAEPGLHFATSSLLRLQLRNLLLVSLLVPHHEWINSNLDAIPFPTSRIFAVNKYEISNSDIRRDITFQSFSSWRLFAHKDDW